jgi:hypothetical protein
MSDFAARLTFAHGKTLEFDGPADITKETTEAVVNAANSSLLGGGGVDGAIHRAGGPSILQECKRIVAKIGNLPAGKAVITTGGRLPAKFVIHTVGPVYRGGQQHEAGTLASCYRESIPGLPFDIDRCLRLSCSRGRCHRRSHHCRSSAALRPCGAHPFRALRHCHLQSLRSSRRRVIPAAAGKFRYLKI